ncbi:hypothetical protein DRO34_04705 [Candidatus Bathyarchaeota archaeon]|nr:MAG: hypothetical protein DRO34_04705 [Candidatus Bathyarchaeota archaeon]
MNISPQITMVSKYFYPEPCSTGQLLMELGLELQRRGCKVNVITGQASLVGHKKLPSRGNHEGIEIKRVWCTSLNNNKIQGKAINRVTFTTLVFLHLLLKKNPPLFVTSDPPFLCWIGMVLKKLRNRKFIYLLYDVHPDASVKLGYLKSRSLVRKIWDQINKLVYKEADFIIVPGDCVKKTIERQFGNISHKMIVIHNWADGSFIKPINKNNNWFCKKYGLNDKFVVMYSGNIGRYHDLETVILVAEKLKHLEDIKFVFIGEGDKKAKIMQMAQDLRLKNILFLPFQPRKYLPYSLTCGDVSIVTLEKGLEGLSVPCKIYTALAAGQAVWGLIGNGSEVAEIIKKYKCGFRIDQGDVNSAVRNLVKLYSDKELLATTKKNARKCFEKNFDKSLAIEKYLEIIKKVQ